MTDLRMLRAQRLLAENGLSTRLGVVGQGHDVLAVQAPFTELRQLRELAPELKALGFKYVALELNTEDRV